MSTSDLPPSLVSTSWLFDRLDDPRIRIVEVDEDTSAYRDRGHLPGAVLWDWTGDLQHPTRRDYIDAPGLTALLERSGIGAGDQLVLYGGNHNWFAAYALWLLELRGFGGARLLDGGRSKWESENLPLTSEEPEVEPPTEPVRLAAGRSDVRASRDFVLNGPGRAAFVDVRSAGEFEGTVLAPPHLPQEQPYVGGHIPGAFNVPWGSAVAADGTFRPAAELRELYSPLIEAAGEAPIVAYCRIGERAAHTWFALSKILQVEDAKNYDGSWTEYGSLVDVPVELGPRKGAS